MRRILVGLDGSPLAESILPFVETLARKMGAAVTLVHVSAIPDDLPRGADVPSIDELATHDRALAAQYLREQQSRLAVAGIETSIVTAAGSPAAEIVACATRTAADQSSHRTGTRPPGTVPCAGIRSASA